MINNLRKQMDMSIESFWVILINNADEILGYKKIGDGTINFCQVDFRKMMRTIINVDDCSKVVISHNHPSGSLIPSKDDIDITYKIKLMLNEIKVKLTDHVIVTDNYHYSFKANGGI